MLEDQEQQAREVLDDLLDERLLPFKLNAHTVERVGPEDYIVLFFARRLNSVDVVWGAGRRVKDAFREAFPAGC